MGSYRVVGDRAFQGHEPGEVFDAELTGEQEQRAIARGSIAPAGAGTSPGYQRDQDNEGEDQPDDTGDTPEEGTEL